MSTARSRTGSLSARAAAGVTFVTALSLAVAVGAVVPAAMAMVGALVVAWGVRALGTEDTLRTATGSVGLVAGCGVFGGAFVAAVGDGGQFVLTALALAAFVVALEAVDGFSVSSAERLRLAVSESGTVVVLGLVAIVVLTPVLASTAAAWLFEVGAGAVFASRIGAFWWLQAGVLAAAALLPRTVARFARLVDPSDESDDAESDTAESDTGASATAESDAAGALADRFGVSPGELPRWYAVAFVGQLLLAGFGPANALVDEFVSARPVVGAVVDAVLLSGVLHGLVLAVVLALCAMLSTTRLQRGILRWAGDEPGERVAVATGGLVAVLVGVVLTMLTAVGTVDPFVSAGNSFWGSFSVLGTVVPLFLLLVVGLLVVAASTAAVRYVLGAVSPPGRAYAVAAALVFAGAVLVAGQVPAWGVVAGVAAAVLVWDLGAHARALERDLATAVPSARTEVVHITAAALVLMVAVGLAAVVGYHVVPVRPPDAGERATVALGLTLVSLVSFAVALQR